MKKKELLIKYFITLFVLIVVSFIFFLVFYQFNFRLSYISNSLFFINISVFVVSLIMQTGATRTFIPMSYTFKTWFKYKDTKEKYDNFDEYYKDNEKNHKKDVKHIMLASITLILIAIILAIIYTKSF